MNTLPQMIDRIANKSDIYMGFFSPSDFVKRTTGVTVRLSRDES